MPYEIRTPGVRRVQFRKHPCPCCGSAVRPCDCQRRAFCPCKPDCDPAMFCVPVEHGLANGTPVFECDASRWRPDLRHHPRCFWSSHRDRC